MNGYLSSEIVTEVVKRICRDAEQAFYLISCTEWGLQAHIVTNMCVGSYPAFPPLQLALRYISVALSLKSPSQAVSLHSCSVVLGLSSWVAPRNRLAVSYAKIVLFFSKIVNRLETRYGFTENVRQTPTFCEICRRNTVLAQCAAHKVRQTVAFARTDACHAAQHCLLFIAPKGNLPPLQFFRVEEFFDRALKLP